MKDIDTLKEMFDRANIEYETKKYKDKLFLSVERGYAGFATEFSFSLDGQLLDMGAYE